MRKGGWGGAHVNPVRIRKRLNDTRITACQTVSLFKPISEGSS